MYFFRLMSMNQTAQQYGFFVHASVNFLGFTLNRTMHRILKRKSNSIVMRRYGDSECNV
jgi:hypothetical protein